MAEPVSNTPELTVSELSGALKRTLEDAFGHVRVRGEVSRVSRPGSGHVYFDLKDENAVISAVIWKGVASRLRTQPEQGLEVIATGRVTTFPGQSKYQIVIEAMEPAGIGALMALLEERRKKLQAEGLFEPARKRRLPFLPGVIGIVTSPTGAVIRDVIHRLSDRFPRHVLLWPVRVQGEGSAAEVEAAIGGFNAIPGDDPNLPRPDVLIIARGGGSIEDLWSFNEEIVIRAAAASEIPLVSAIGHETDWTLLDLVADIRAPTPTAAAEMVVPVRAELLAALRDREARLVAAIARGEERRRRDFANLARALPPPERALEAPRQRLDRAGERIVSFMKAGIDRRQLALAALSRRLGAQTPEARLARVRERLDQFGHRLARALQSRIAIERRDADNRKARLAEMSGRLLRAGRTHQERLNRHFRAEAQLLESLGYRRVLARGYAVVHAADGGVISRAGAIVAGDALQIEFTDGRVGATASGGMAPLPVTRKRPREVGGQGSLF